MKILNWVLVLWFLIVLININNAAGFDLASFGCPMAHCNNRMSDYVMTTPPLEDITILWHDSGVFGSNFGLGCSSNDEIAACTFYTQQGGAYLKVYDAYGNEKWNSGDILDSPAWLSVPLISEYGSVITGDLENIVKFNPDGSLAWQAETIGTVISPVISDNEEIITATTKGWVQIYNSKSGENLANLYLKDWGFRKGYWKTFNTPSLRGNRIYIVTEFICDGPIIAKPGRLYAIDLEKGANDEYNLNVAWFFEFRSPSGASPLIIDDVIFFDGHGLYPRRLDRSYMFGIKDKGDTYKLLWKKRMGLSIQVSPAEDPRGGLWIFSVFDKTVKRLSVTKGKVLQEINIDVITNEPGIHLPSSVISIASTPEGHPVMIITAAAVSSVYLIAIDLVEVKLLWKVKVAGLGRIERIPYGQHPIIKQSENSVIVSSTYGNGVFGVG